MDHFDTLLRSLSWDRRKAGTRSVSNNAFSEIGSTIGFIDLKCLRQWDDGKQDCSQMHQNKDPLPSSAPHGGLETLNAQWTQRNPFNNLKCCLPPIPRSDSSILAPNVVLSKSTSSRPNSNHNTRRRKLTRESRFLLTASYRRGTFTMVTYLQRPCK